MHVHYPGKCNDVDTWKKHQFFHPVLTGIKEQFISASTQVCGNWIEAAGHCNVFNLTFLTLLLPSFDFIAVCWVVLNIS